MSTRTPDQILEEFGRELRAAKPKRRWRLWLAATLATTVIGVPAALATRPVWRPQPAATPEIPAGAPQPQSATPRTQVAHGDGWTLDAATCTFKDHETVVLSLSTPAGGAARRCDALTPEAAAGPVAPPVLYVDPQTHQGLLFGAVPPNITRVEAVFHRAGRTRSELRAIPLNGTYFVAPVAEDARVLSVIGLDARGEPRLHCDTRACEERP